MSIICYYIVDAVPSSINPLTDIVPHQVIPQYENVDMITNTLPTTELEMNTCIKYILNVTLKYELKKQTYYNVHFKLTTILQIVISKQPTLTNYLIV